jgi:cyclopropane-fatty-acyl-phospholipid synthase
MITRLINLAEKGLMPDFIVRYGIRTLLKRRLTALVHADPAINKNNKDILIQAMDEGPIALVPELANKQHYEIPSTFYDLCLGKNKKYSSCFWNKTAGNLDSAEDLALKLTCEHADLKDGMNILELGCGWGSLSLWMAEKFPNASITSVSNSSSQKDYIMHEANSRNIKNLQVITCDMNDFQTHEIFDRVVSVEMIEHMRNHRKLFNRIASWLKPDGLFFMHIFVHKSQPYFFEVQDDDDWMSQYFFSGGMMPSEDLTLIVQDRMMIKDQWQWSGQNYEKTANAWLENIDRNYDQAIKVLEGIYGKDSAVKWMNRWRIFFMACAELWGYKNGKEWLVSHYLFKK